MRKIMVLLGKPKVGKSTFTYSAPGDILSFNYDGGNPCTPPGFTSRIYIQDYPVPVQDVDLDKERWVTASNVGKAIIADIREVNEAFRQRREVRLVDPINGEKVELPLPATLILDGWAEMMLQIEYWIMGINKVTSAKEYNLKIGNNNQYAFYTERLAKLTNIVNLVKALPCNVLINTWEKLENPDEPNSSPIIPELGGKLSEFGPGKVDACVRMYADNGKYMMLTKPDGRTKCLGVRGAYNLEAKIDMTLNGTNKLTPWQRLWGA